MFKMGLTSLERLIEYKGDGVPQEAAWFLPTDEQLLYPGAAVLGAEGAATRRRSRSGSLNGIREKQPHQASMWPAKGGVEFEDVSLVYRQGLPPAVSSVSFRIGGGQRVGVVGRTGAGKSSLVVLLFRIVEPSSGVVRIDGADTTTLGLQTLRQCMSVIPQSPLLIKGTVRYNLDPFGLHSEERLRETMRKVGLPPELLDNKVGGGDSTSGLSAGQQQMLSFGRTLLTDAKIHADDRR